MGQSLSSIYHFFPAALISGSWTFTYPGLIPHDETTRHPVPVVVARLSLRVDADGSDTGSSPIRRDSTLIWPELNLSSLPCTIWGNKSLSTVRPIGSGGLSRTWGNCFIKSWWGYTGRFIWSLDNIKFHLTIYAVVPIVWGSICHEAHWMGWGLFSRGGPSWYD